METSPCSRWAAVRTEATRALQRSSAVPHQAGAAAAAPRTSSNSVEAQLLRALVLAAHAEMELQRAETRAVRMESLLLGRGAQVSPIATGEEELSCDDKKTIKALQRMRLETLAQVGIA